MALRIAMTGTTAGGGKVAEQGGKTGQRCAAAPWARTRCTALPKMPTRCRSRERESAGAVSLGCTLTPDIRALLDRPSLARMKPGAIVVNAARAERFDAQALLEALPAQRIWSGIDCFVDAPLLSAPNVGPTPRIGGVTTAAFRVIDVGQRGTSSRSSIGGRASSPWKRRFKAGRIGKERASTRFSGRFRQLRSSSKRVTPVASKMRRGTTLSPERYGPAVHQCRLAEWSLPIFASPVGPRPVADLRIRTAVPSDRGDVEAIA
jgi:D-isomer specific 2-hydroxyacid dehydrogenase, NAD binding domain